MTENRGHIHKYAMHFGTYMGIFWILKFILFPLGIEIPFLQLLFLALTIAVPFLGYYYARMFREKICGGSITFFQSWFFTLLMYIFASLLTAVAHYIYFRFLDHRYLYDTYSKIVQEAKALKVTGTEEMLTQFENALGVLGDFTPIELTMQLISQNVFYGSIPAIPTALLVMKKPKNSGILHTKNEQM